MRAVTSAMLRYQKVAIDCYLQSIYYTSTRSHLILSVDIDYQTEKESFRALFYYSFNCSACHKL